MLPTEMGECAVGGRFAWRDKGFSLHHAEFLVVMDRARGNISEAVRDAGLEGRRQFWNGEAYHHRGNHESRGV